MKFFHLSCLVVLLMAAAKPPSTPPAKPAGAFVIKTRSGRLVAFLSGPAIDRFRRDGMLAKLGPAQNKQPIVFGHCCHGLAVRIFRFERGNIVEHGEQDAFIVFAPTWSAWKKREGLMINRGAKLAAPLFLAGRMLDLKYKHLTQSYNTIHAPLEDV